MDKLKSIVRAAKSVTYTDLENKVRECTSNEAWGASSSQVRNLLAINTLSI